jgi:TolB-like protein
MGSPEDKVPHQDPPHKAQAPTAIAHPVVPDPKPLDSFWARIRRHKVVEWTLAYAAFGYATLHLVEMLRDAFEWPVLVPRLTVFSLVLGAPVAVTLAWYHGHRAQHRVSRRELSILIALMLVAGSLLWLVSRHERVAVPRVAMRATSAGGTGTAEATFSPPPHSIAVLPFVNISGDKEQEYFSDGLTEELLDSLSRINELQVAARTSSFYFKGKDVDLGTVAHKLNVASVLEGSVRRSGNTVRITAQLNNAVTGYHLWSQTYDRDLNNVLTLQTEIANAVANALKVTLLGNVAAKVELGGTHNPDAFDAYLRASSVYYKGDTLEGHQRAIALYTESIRLDPNYARAVAA